MIAYINGLKVKGTPKEIEEYRQISSGKTRRKIETQCDCIDWRDLQASPFCPKCHGSGSY